MVIKNLLRRKVRSLLTLAGIAISIAAIVALGAMADGLATYYALFGRGGGDLLVTQAKAVAVIFSAIDEEVGLEISRLPGVESVSGMLITLPSVEGVPYFVVFGYDPDEFAIEHFKVIEGEPLSAKSGGRGKPLLLGRMAANNLDKGVGDILKLSGSIFRVVGIYETGAPIEESGAVIPLKEAQAIAGRPRQVNACLIRLKRLGQMEWVREHIERRFPDLSVTASAEFADRQGMLAYVRGFAWAVSLLAVLIGGIGGMNTMLMNVFERTREIGTLRALGWRRGRVLRMVLGESLALSSIGGLVGMGLGVGAVRALSRHPATVGFLSGRLSPGLFVQAFLVALALGAVGGLYPAHRASQLMPLEALRATDRRADIRLPVGGLALRNLFRRRTRTMLTLIGIGIGIVAVVVLRALADGLVAGVTDMAAKGGMELVAMQAGTSMDLSTIDEGVVKRIAALPGVKWAEGFLTGYAILPELPFFVVFGYHPAGYGVRDFQIVEGEPLSANRQIILGRVAAENLKKEVGETMKIFDTVFRIVGIYETGVPFEDGGGVISLRDAQMLFKQPRKVSFMGIKLENPDQAEEVRGLIEERFPQVSVSMASDFADEVVDLRVTRFAAWAIALLAIVIGGVGMANTMVMSVFERTREIGVLRALGWRRMRILVMILRESIALSTIGGLAGIAGGVAIGQILGAMPLVTGLVRPSFGPGLLVQALAIALALGTLGGLYPAWWASQLAPVEALRYE
ncbi:MAG TPA: FtsX-like permease family protein [Anaerolineae bacterium]|nr:FtsX-like permease family protein [Anaerolineae bacterium]